jgi:hypothetical protein
LQKGATIDERLGRIHSFCRKWVENPRSSRIEARPNPRERIPQWRKLFEVLADRRKLLVLHLVSLREQ